MNNVNANKDFSVFKTSITTPNELYEMVYDMSQHTTSFLKITRGGTVIESCTEVTIEGVTYKPLPPTYDLINKKVILFPAQTTEYVSEIELLQDIQNFIHKYLDITDVFEQIATYYVLFTWLFDKFNEVPYLRAIGDFGSGKSRFIQTIGILCYKPVFTGGATTPSPIFRIINEVHGTLIIDEADFKSSDMTSEIVKILNTGYQKGIPVLRSEGKGTFEVKAYDVFCPKIVATRETFADKALESRFLVEEMGMSRLRTDIPRTLDESFYQDALEIRNKLLMWRLKNYFEPIEQRDDLIEGIHPRLNQIIIPLLSIIKDDQIRENLKTFIVKYNSDLVADRSISWESDIVLAIHKLEFKNQSGELAIKDITDEINRMTDITDETLQARKTGWYLRQKLQLKLYRTRKGYMISMKDNRRKLDMWKERFGITDAEVQGVEVDKVNDMNIVNDIENSELF